jgi:hypothetical protein
MGASRTWRGSASVVNSRKQRIDSASVTLALYGGSRLQR